MAKLKGQLLGGREVLWGTWKTIPEFPAYEVSTKGFTRLKGDTFPKKRRDYGKSRLAATLRKNKKSYYRYVHRMMWQAHVGPIRPGYHIDHIDGDWENNALANLRMLSPKEHAVFTRLTRRPRLTDEKVRALLDLYWKHSVPTVEISRRVSIPDALIKRVVDYRAYVNVTPNNGPLLRQRKLWKTLQA